MEENSLNTQPTTPVFKPQQNSNFLVVLLSILLLLACLIAGFFAYQTQNLVKDLTKLRTIPTPTPVETINLRSYASDNLNISIQFPNNLIVNDGCLADKKQCGLSLGREGTGGLFFEVSKIFNMTVIKMFESDSKQYGGFLEKDVERPILTDTTLDYKKAKTTIFKNAAMGADMRTIYIQISNDVIKVSLPAYENSPANQVLSTFKFIEPVANDSQSPIACTMDVKVCPDGSYVSRTGPKCEFAQCPN